METQYRLWQVIVGALLMMWGMSGLWIYLRRASMMHGASNSHAMHVMYDVMGWGIVIGPIFLAVGLLLAVTAKKKPRVT